MFRSLILALCCVLSLAACTSQEDAWRSHFEAGRNAEQQKLLPKAIKEYETAALLAELELKALDAGSGERRKIVLQRQADSLAASAKLRLDRSELAAARADLLRALAVRRMLHEENHESVATLYSALARVAYEQEKFAEAEDFASRSYQIRLKLLGDKHPHVAIAANNLAEIYQKRGKDVDAEKMFEQSIDIYRRSDDQPGLLDVLNNVAMFYKKQGRWQDARAIINTALELQKDEGSATDAERAMTLNALGAVNKAMYEYEEADNNYKEAIALLDRNPEKSAAALCDALDNYADFLLMQSEYDKAEGIYKRAIAMCEKSRGATHSSTAERLVDLGILYKNEGRLKEAEAALKRALDIQELSFEVDSPVILHTLYKLSAVYQAEKKYDQVSKLYERFLPKLRKKDGDRHPYVADVLENWANVLDDSPLHKEKVKQLLAEAASIRGKKHINVKRAAEDDDDEKDGAPSQLVTPKAIKQEKG